MPDAIILERLELIEKRKNGDYRLVQDYFASPDGVPSEAIKKFHKQMIYWMRKLQQFCSTNLKVNKFFHVTGS